MRKIYFAANMKYRDNNEVMAKQQHLVNLIQLSGPVEAVIPARYYNYMNNWHKTEREIKDYELMRLSECDLLIVDFDRINESVGSHFEIATAETLARSGKPVFILGWGDPEGVHPWILEACSRIERDDEALAQYIADYFI